MSPLSSPWSSGAVSPTYAVSTRYSRVPNQPALGQNMNYQSFQALSSSRHGHSRTRSTMTVPRSPWFTESRNASPPLGSGSLLPSQMSADTLGFGQMYCIDRGNGEYTRLIPADMLPALNEVPARQSQPHGMVILPPLGQSALTRPFTVQNDGHMVQSPQKQIDQIVSRSPSSKRNKIYCDKWVHEGVCAFTQQGCKFKHEMPVDETTQRSLGLFQGFPGWWRKRQEEQKMADSVADLTQSPTARTRAWPAHDSSHGGSHGLIGTRDGAGGDSQGARSQWLRNGIVPFIRGPLSMSSQSQTNHALDASNSSQRCLDGEGMSSGDPARFNRGFELC